MSDYTPISCAQHSELELHIMHRQPLRLRLRDGDATREERLLPVDIGAESGAEYLHAQRDDGERLKIRLDTIVHFEPA